MADVVASGCVLTPDGVVRGEVVAEDGLIVDVVSGGADTDRWVCPGFIDLQCNGAEGIDVTSRPERIGELAAVLAWDGVTAFLPTVVTCADEVRAQALASFARHVPAGGAAPLGLHLEGPLLSPRRAGAHAVDHLVDVAVCPTKEWTPSNGVILVTIAPELPGALELIGELVACGVTVSLGHTDASAEEFVAGLDAGATYVTHLFNAMRPFDHRDPGPIGAVFADDTVVAGIICDGVHVDRIAVQMAWRALGPERINLVTDAVAARGTGRFPDGVRTASGVLAGSVLSLDAALRALAAYTGASVVDAVRTVTQTPARVLGLDDRGVVAAGARADLTVLDPDLRVVDVVIAGRHLPAAR